MYSQAYVSTGEPVWSACERSLRTKATLEKREAPKPEDVSWRLTLDIGADGLRPVWHLSVRKTWHRRTRR